VGEFVYLGCDSEGKLLFAKHLNLVVVLSSDRFEQVNVVFTECGVPRVLPNENAVSALPGQALAVMLVVIVVAEVQRKVELCEVLLFSTETVEVEASSLNTGSVEAHVFCSNGDTPSHALLLQLAYHLHHSNPQFINLFQLT
jgi:hypothetical protein